MVCWTTLCRQDFGGLNMAAKAVNGGHDSDLYIDTIRTGSDPKIEIVSHVIQRELQSKYLNPAWIKVMQASGYDGAHYMSEMTDNLSLWNSTAKQSVQSETWEAVNQVYLNDKYHLGMKRYFEQSNPYAKQVLLATLLDVASRGYWQATPSEKSAVASELARSAAIHGLAGSADLNRDKTLTKIVGESIAGLPEGRTVLRRYMHALSASTGSPATSSLLARPSETANTPHPLSLPRSVTGLVLRETASRATTADSHESSRIIFVVSIISLGRLLIGWSGAGKEIY